VPHRPQKAGNLTTVMGSVIHNMQHDLPGRGHVRIALRVFVGNLFVNRVFGQCGAPLLPPRKQRWPVILKYRQMHVLLWNDKACRRISFDPPKPDAVAGVDVHERAENTVVGSAKVSHQFLRTERAGSGDQSAASPSGVAQMAPKYIYGHCHKCAQVYTVNRLSHENVHRAPDVDDRASPALIISA